MEMISSKKFDKNMILFVNTRCSIFRVWIH